MISKEALGSRVREIRQRRKMTLKDVEQSSGLSATHISEIERGMTSPTVGALIRIAGALEKDPGFFVEPRELDEVCVRFDSDPPSERPPEGVSIRRGRCASLTQGVLGGRISGQEFVLDPGGCATIAWLRVGDDACFFCVAGAAELADRRPGASGHRSVIPFTGVFPPFPWRSARGIRDAACSSSRI